MNIRTSQLGLTFTFRALRNQCQAVWGGVAWPSKRPGFAVVLGMVHEPHFQDSDVYLLDEFESFDTRKLVRACGVFDDKYYISATKDYFPKATDCWIGDYKNDAASRFIREMNEATSKTFGVRPSMILEMENVYGFILPQLKEMCSPERRQLFLKGGRTVDYLGEIDEAEMADLKVGEFPAIEALGFTVIGMRKALARDRKLAVRPHADPHGYDEPFLEWGKKTFALK